MSYIERKRINNQQFRQVFQQIEIIENYLGYDRTNPEILLNLAIAYESLAALYRESASISQYEEMEDEGFSM